MIAKTISILSTAALVVACGSEVGDSDATETTQSTSQALQNVTCNASSTGGCAGQTTYSLAPDGSSYCQPADNTSSPTCSAAAWNICSYDGTTSACRNKAIGSSCGSLNHCWDVGMVGQASTCSCLRYAP